jgi:hypothetical protein
MYKEKKLKAPRPHKKVMPDVANKRELEGNYEQLY